MTLGDNDFAHLHVHTEYSVLDGAGRISDLVKHVSELGQTSVAITDHGAMYGVQEFYEACRKAKIKPILGVESYLAQGQRTDRIKGEKPYHLLLLAQNNKGYENLKRLATIAQLEGFYNRPRVDHEVLAQYNEGIIVTSGCLAGEIPQAVMMGDEDAAVKALKWYKEVFGDRFYLEAQYRLNSPDQKRINEWVLKAGREHDVKVVATTDAHYVRKADADMHDTLLCIQTGAEKSMPGYHEVRDPKAQPTRMKFDEDSYYITSVQEMLTVFKDTPEVLTNTRDVADRIDVTFENTGYHLPKYPVPGDHNAESFLRELCYIGLPWRYGENAAQDAALTKRLDYELSIITQMNFDTYFLVVWDICQYAYHQNIWWNVRGSGAGSLVAYCLGITGVDPMLSGLFFERFLNPGRISMPDIDMDFEDTRRDELIKYVVTKYGSDRVAGIITYGTMSGKSAIRDTGRALSVPKDVIATLTPHIIIHQGKTLALDTYKDESESLRKVLADNPQAANLYAKATELQRYKRSTGTHAAGIVIADTDLVEYVPLHRLTAKAFAKTGLTAITQFDMGTIESLGLLKVDFLGLSTLTVMRLACELIEKRYGLTYTMDNIPYRHDGVTDTTEIANLDKAFKLISDGFTAGVFQVEGDGMTEKIKEMKPSLYEHIVAIISLYRPGPLQFIPSYIARMHGEEPVEYRHEKLSEILAETYGIVIYQEQIISIASQLFGYSPGEADKIRKAVGKKLKDDLEKHHKTFLTKGPENGISVEAAEAIWQDIVKFADYGFNKAHASDYAKVTVQTAYLKAHYPLEYMTALVQAYIEKTDKIVRVLDECRKMDIEVLPPDINHSQATFSIEITPDGREAIRCGLTMVKGVGENEAQKFIDARGTQPFVSMDELIKRLDLNAINKTVISNLIKIGAFKRLGDRYTLVSLVDALKEYSKKQWKDKSRKQKKLFEVEIPPLDLQSLARDAKVDLTEMGFTDRTMLDWERELIGFYVTARPSDKYRPKFREYVTTHIAGIEALDRDEQDELNGKMITVGGEIMNIRKIMDKRGREMAFVDLQDWNDTAHTISITFFASTWETCKDYCRHSDMVVIKGKFDNTRGQLAMLADTAVSIATF